MKANMQISAEKRVIGEYEDIELNQNGCIFNHSPMYFSSFIFKPNEVLDLRFTQYGIEAYGELHKHRIMRIENIPKYNELIYNCNGEDIKIKNQKRDLCIEGVSTKYIATNKKMAEIWYSAIKIGVEVWGENEKEEEEKGEYSKKPYEDEDNPELCYECNMHFVIENSS